MEDTELLKAALAVAVADGRLQRSEMGVVEGLAKRIGLGQVSFEAMLEAAQNDPSFADDILIQPKAKARSALELLVGLARIDGLISDEEREVIARIATSLGITGDEFEKVYLAGIQRADEIRRRKSAPG
jgi:tellurite resistance protein